MKTYDVVKSMFLVKTYWVPLKLKSGTGASRVHKQQIHVYGEARQHSPYGTIFENITFGTSAPETGYELKWDMHTKL